jgi:hypothetical protein
MEAPSRSPQLAISANLVTLAFGAGNNIYVATSIDQGQTFAQLVKVAEAGVVPLSRHRGPRIAIAGKAIVVTAVVGHTEAAGEHAHGLAADGDLLAWRSLDGGKTWSHPARVNDVPSAPREGLHTLAADSRGNLFAAWLDLRGKGTALYGAFSTDSGATWSPNVRVYASPSGSICECCHPSAAFAPDGALDVMWRNALEGGRDLYLARASDGRNFGSPRKLGTGTWKLNACPMDGGGLAHVDGRTVTAWRRGEDLYLDEPGTLEVKLGEGKDVALAAGEGRVRAVWIKGTEVQTWSAGTVETIGKQAGFPSIAPLRGGGFLVAWEENGKISVRALP